MKILPVSERIKKIHAFVSDQSYDGCRKISHQNTPGVAPTYTFHIRMKIRNVIYKSVQREVVVFRKDISGEPQNDLS
jgi:hypothetical protein